MANCEQREGLEARKIYLTGLEARKIYLTGLEILSDDGPTYFKRKKLSLR
jgi:hypothetical protein